MALSATINKVSMNIADMNRHYYQQYDLTMAMHPSETSKRFIVRLIAFSLHAHEDLVFTKGLSTDEEPDIWQKSLTGELELWIDLGQVDEKRVRKACGRSKRVIVYTYHQGKSAIWWKQNQQKFARHANLEVFQIIAEGAESLVDRTMHVQCNIDDGEVYLSDASNAFSVSITKLSSSTP